MPDLIKKKIHRTFNLATLGRRAFYTGKPNNHHSFYIVSARTCPWVIHHFAHIVGRFMSRQTMNLA